MRMGSRLAHLIEGKNELFRRWKGQRLNRRLRKKISELNKVIDDHCKALSQQQWDDLCESIDGQMRNGKSWGMLKHLLDESGSKSHQKLKLARALHKATSSHTVDVLVSKLIQKYLPIRGPPRPELDEDFSVAEVRQAIFALNRKSAPGQDGVTNRMFTNLDDPSIVFLTDRINESWKSGVVPEEWNSACTVLIPKPGKAPNIENLRPISLTSCVGKVIERVVLKRLNGYLDDNDVLTYNTIGFRTGLSTQDAMKLIKHQIVDGRSIDVKALLGLDLENGALHGLGLT